MAPVGQQNSARALSHRSCSTELTLVLRVPFVVIVADCAGLRAVQDADGTVAEGCAFPVAPAGEWRRPGPEGLQRRGQPSGGGNDGTLRPGDAPEPRALPRVLAGTRPRRLLATRPPSRSARWFGNIAPVRAERRRRHPPASRPPDKTYTTDVALGIPRNRYGPIPKAGRKVASKASVRRTAARSSADRDSVRDCARAAPRVRPCIVRQALDLCHQPRHLPAQGQ